MDAFLAAAAQLRRAPVGADKMKILAHQSAHAILTRYDEVGF